MHVNYSCQHDWKVKFRHTTAKYAKVDTLWYKKLQNIQGGARAQLYLILLFKKYFHMKIKIEKKNLT